jgi:predicted transcriptional regulator
MTGDLGDVSYLARSENRIEVLDALTTGPQDRHALETVTGASRVTVGRILAEFDRRGWAVPADDQFEITAVGRAVATDVARLRETLAAADVLEPMARSLSPEFLSVDVRRFADAELIRADERNPLAVARIAPDVMASAQGVRILAAAVTGDTIDAQIRAARENEQVSEVVMTTGTIEAIHADGHLSERVRTSLSLEGVSLFETDEDVPVSLGIYDDETVFVGLIDDDGMPTATLISENEAVLSWANETFERFREHARPIRRDEFAK